MLAAPPAPIVLEVSYNTAEIEIIASGGSELRYAVYLSESSVGNISLSASQQSFTAAPTTTNSAWRQAYTGPAQIVKLGSLASSRRYTVRVKSFVEGESSDWSVTTVFQTKCLSQSSADAFHSQKSKPQPPHSLPRTCTGPLRGTTRPWLKTVSTSSPLLISLILDETNYTPQIRVAKRA